MNHRQRIAERNRYNPMFTWHRDVRVVSRNGATQTFKHTGDVIIHPLAAELVVESGWTPQTQPYHRETSLD